MRDRQLVKFASTFDSYEEYVRCVNKKGIKKELLEFGVMVPSWLKYDDLKRIYVIILESWEREHGGLYKE